MPKIPRLRLKVTKQRYSQLKKTMLNDSPSHNPAQSNLTESDLPEGQAFYQQMFERNRAIKLVIDPITGQIIEANQSACNFYGYTLEQLKSKTIFQINTQPESEVRAGMERIVADKGATFQAQHRLAAGAVRDVEVFTGLLEVNNKRYLYCIIQDITERKRVEKALYESEARYRTLARHMPHTSVVLFDNEMRYTLVEGEFLARFNIDLEHAIGKTPQETLSEDSVNFIVPIYKRALAGESFGFERVTENYAYQSFITPLRDADGRITGGIILSHDITAIKQAEKALRASEALYRLLARHMPNTSVVMFDMELRFTIAEGPYLKRFGTVWDNVVGKQPKDVYEEEPLNYLLPIYKRALQGEAFTFERVTENYAYESYAAPVRDYDGQIIGGIILSHDITKRKQAEDKFRALLESAPDAMVIVNQQGNIVLVNSQTETLFGYARAELIDKPIEILIPERFHSRHPVYREGYIADPHVRGMGVGLELFALRKDGSQFPVEVSLSPINTAEGVLITSVVRDITERKRAEKALHEREALYRLFTEHMTYTSVIMFDKDKRFTLAEGDFLKSVGLESKSMIGKMPEEVFSGDPNTFEFMQPQYERVLRGEAFAYDRTTPNYAYQAYASPLHDASGQIIGGMFLSHDITEAKRNEAALRASEERYHSLVDLAPVGIIETDINGKRVFCNSRWCEMTGLTLEEALGDVDYQTIYPEDLPIAASAWEEMMKTGLPFDNAIFRYQRPDKTVVWVSGNGRPLYDAQGTISGYIGSVNDITERKLLEEALITSESRFRTLIDFAPVGIVETDAQGMLILGNPYWYSLSGISPDRAFVATGSETLHPDDLARLQAVNQYMLENNSYVDNLEYRFLHPDGKVVWVSDSSRPLLNADGMVTGYIMSIADITERKRLEDALRQNEERLQNITDNLEDLVLQSDAEGNFVFASPSYQTLLGYEPNSLLGTSALAMIHPDDFDYMNQAFQTAFETSTQQFSVECRLRHADGHYISVEIVGKLFFDSKSNFMGGIFVSRDISERKRMQNLVIEKEKLQTALDKELELNNLKTRMMTRIAHEFRTPLTVIQAATETLTHYLDRLTPAQRVAKDVTIKSQIQRLTDMLNEIGLVVRTDFTPDRVHRSQTDLSALCRQIAGKLERDLNQSGRFVLDLPEKTYAIVDAQVLHNAFMHVMRNAARFSEATLPVNVRLSQTENSITLHVTDNGIGIPPNEQPRIFEPFFRGSNINELSGLGVGLTTARAAVEAHGGTISVDSVLGQGTTVTIWIPT